MTVNVYYQKILMGRLALKERQCFFEYNPEFLKTGLEVSPFKLALKPGLISNHSKVFEGLFGVFNDSLPDGWGRLLLDRKLLSQGIEPNRLSPLDRLLYVGNHGMGALSYQPAIDNTTGSNTPLPHLDVIAAECAEVQADSGLEFIDELLQLNGSSAGARPKIVTPEWIIKFPATFDPKDIGAIEYAYHLMAVAAGLDVPEAQLFPSQKHAGYFGVKRFDRKQNEAIHMHTASGLLHIDHRDPHLDYETLLRATLHLTRNIVEVEKQLRATAFNIFAHNRDDHAKNFSFLMDNTGTWSVSPAYDLTFSAGPQGEHATTLMGEGKNPSINHLHKLANIVGIPQTKATNIFAQVQAAINQWPKFAKEAGVSTTSSKRINRALTLP